MAGLLASEIMDEAALLLNDASRLTFTYTIQIPWLKRAINQFTDELAVNSIKLLNKTGVVVYPVVGATTTIAMPPDCLIPTKLEERALGSSDAWIPMTEVGSISANSNIGQSSFLIWAFQGTLLNSVPVIDVPTITGLKEIRVTYERFLPYSGITSASDFTTALTIQSKGFLASKVAEFISRFVLANKQRADELKPESGMCLHKIVQVWTRNKQNKPVRHTRFNVQTDFIPATPVSSGGSSIVINSNNILDWTNVKNAPYNAKGDGLTDDTTAIIAAYNATPTGGTLYFPKGVYIITGLICNKTIDIRGDGAYSVIRNTGAGKDAIFFDGLTIGYIIAASVRDISICGSAGTRDGLRLSQVHQSVFENVKVCGTGATGFHLMGCLLNSFIGCSASTNLTNFSGLPIAVMQRGWHLDSQVGGIGDSNGNTFTACHAEGITTAPGIGFDVYFAFGNSFISCISESNTVGLNLGQDIGIEATRNSFVSIYFEANGTNTIGNRNNNAFIGSYDLVDFVNWFGDVTVQDTLNLGATPATGGMVNLTNNKYIRARGVAGGGANLIGMDTGNVILIGDPNFSLSLNGPIGFYGVAPVLRQLFPTGTGKTVDQLITALQLLGLLRQV